MSVVNPADLRAARRRWTRPAPISKVNQAAGLHETNELRSEAVFTRISGLLDQSGGEPRLHGMLKSLAEADTGDPNVPVPMYVDIWKIDIDAPNDKEFRSGELITALDWNAYSILAGSARKDPKPELVVEQFFHHADVLTGQDVGAVPPHAETVREELEVISGGWVERALDRIEEARIRRPHQRATDDGTTFRVWADLFDHFNTDSALWEESWTSGGAARERFEDLRRWYDGKGMLDNYRLSALEQLSNCLAGFAAVIHGARFDLDNLMGVCVDRVRAWNNAVVERRRSRHRGDRPRQGPHRRRRHQRDHRGIEPLEEDRHVRAVRLHAIRDSFPAAPTW